MTVIKMDGAYCAAEGVQNPRAGAPTTILVQGLRGTSTRHPRRHLDTLLAHTAGGIVHNELQTSADGQIHRGPDADCEVPVWKELLSKHAVRM